MHFQDIIQTLNRFWAERGCLILQPYDTEKGAGTMSPHTVLRAIGPEPWAVAYPDGYSVSLLHTFLQNKGVFGTTWGGPDEIGGFMIQGRGPLYFEDLSWKFAAGVGGTVDQSDGFHANPGFGVHYGVDLHFPIWSRFGPTLSLDAMNVYTQGHHHFGAGLALGFSVF